jgi:hypothetical protein
MSRVARMAISLMIVLTAIGSVHDVPARASARRAQDEFGAVDFAAVPLRPDELQEQGYQVMTGGFLDQNATAGWLADPRHTDPGDVEAMLLEQGWARSYVLDLVLLEDRAYAESDILALVQTNLFGFVDDDGAEAAFDSLKDFRANANVEDLEPAVADGLTVRIVTESGDTMRTMVRVDDTIIEVVTLDVFREVESVVHQATIMATVDRFHAVREAGTPGVAAKALVVADGPDVADLFNAPATGVHQLYRVRDGVVQPAAGELSPPDVAAIAPGLTSLYQSSQGVQIGDGAGFYSSWIGTFEDDVSAVAFMSALPVTSSGALLPDPYFPLWADEEAVGQGVAGVYRVTGTATNSQRFSGSVEIRQDGSRVIGIGWRVLGNVLPSVDVTSRLMDGQLACLDASEPCGPMGVETLVEPGSATPVASHPADLIQSREFGWSVAVDASVWVIGERGADSGHDYVDMLSDRSLVTLESVIDQHGDPQQCVIDELRNLRELEEHAAIDLGSDVAEEQPAGVETAHAWAIYTVEPLAEERADQEYTIRIDCYTLIDGAASLVMTHTSPRDLWADERSKGDVLRHGITFPAGRTEDDALAVERTSIWRHTHVMIDTPWIDLAA